MSVDKMWISIVDNQPQCVMYNKGSKLEKAIYPQGMWISV